MKKKNYLISISNRFSTKLTEITKGQPQNFFKNKKQGKKVPMSKLIADIKVSNKNTYNDLGGDNNTLAMR